MREVIRRALRAGYKLPKAPEMQEWCENTLGVEPEIRQMQRFLLDLRTQKKFPPRVEAHFSSTYVSVKSSACSQFVQQVQQRRTFVVIHRISPHLTAAKSVFRRIVAPSSFREATAMARGEVTGRKPMVTADPTKRKPGPPSADPGAVEPMAHSEPQRSASATKPPIRGPPLAMSIREFCAAARRHLVKICSSRCGARDGGRPSCASARAR